MPLTLLQCFCSKSSSSKALICQVQNVKCHLWNFGHCWVVIWRNKPGVDLCVSNLLKGTSGVKPWKAEGAKSPLGLWRLEGRKGRIEDWGWAAAVGNGRGCHPGEPWDFWTSTLEICNKIGWIGNDHLLHDTGLQPYCTDGDGFESWFLAPKELYTW